MFWSSGDDTKTSGIYKSKSSLELGLNFVFEDTCTNNKNIHKNVGYWAQCNKSKDKNVKELASSQLKHSVKHYNVEILPGYLLNGRAKRRQKCDYYDKFPNGTAENTKTAERLNF